MEIGSRVTILPIRHIGLWLLLAFGYGHTAESQIQLVGHLPYPHKLNDIWGYVDVSTSTEYALVGTRQGTSVVDVSTDSTKPAEVFFAPGPVSVWRDIKTWKSVAYVTNETGDGLHILDLSGLPGSVSHHLWTGGNFRRAHNLFIDEHGYAYIFGADTGNQGAVILDLNPNPLAPIVVGLFDQFYIHDGFVRGDTLWAAAIRDGFFAAIDVSDKSNLTVLASHSTPDQFTHNIWVSDDGRTAFTSDEVAGGFVTSYDISDLANIEELDRIQSSPGTELVPHNAMVKGNFLVTSWYKDGIVIADISRPHNMVITETFDTSPLQPSKGSGGAWGVYPYLPSGRILASDIEEGLFVLRPGYTQAAFLEGRITGTDAIPRNRAIVDLLGTSSLDLCDNQGRYALGHAASGTFTVRVSEPGFQCPTIFETGVTLASGLVTTLDLQLDCILSSYADIQAMGITQEGSGLRVRQTHAASLRLVNLQGREVWRTELTDQDFISLDHIPAGTYIALLESESEFIAAKINLW